MDNEQYDEEGKQIKFRCQSCSEITLHTIITDTDEDSELSIQCSICDETQEYRPKKNLKKPTSSSKKAAANYSTPEQKEKCDLSDYKKLLAKNDVSTAIQYETTLSYKVADVINHRTFGIGFVRKTIFPNKVEALFSVGCKLLICAPRSEPAFFSEGGSPELKKVSSHKPRNPSSWQPWSSNPEEKSERKFSWGDDEPSNAFDDDN